MKPLQSRRLLLRRLIAPKLQLATVIWLALRNITADWRRANQDWKAAMVQFAIIYPDRLTRPAA